MGFDEGLNATLASLLIDSGYEISIHYGGGMKAVLAFGPDLVIIRADPQQLDCCDLLSEIRNSKQTPKIRVLMLVHGHWPERTRGLDLGAHDALSLPFDSAELLSRIRTQLRNKRSEDESEERISNIEENRHSDQQVVSAVNEKSRIFVAGTIAVVLVVIIVGFISVVLYRRGHAENARVYAAITRMQSVAFSQPDLIERSSQSRASQTSSPKAVIPSQISQAVISENQGRAAGNQPDDTAELKMQVATVEDRLEKLENEGNVAHTIINSFEPSVCLIHVVLTFRDRASGLKLHYAEMTSTGNPVDDKAGNPLLSLTGSGPEVQVDVFGTGFLVTDNGQILTNHHVAEPWWQNNDMKEMLDQDLEPIIDEMSAYFPRIPHGISIRTVAISSVADAAVMKGNIAGLGLKRVPLANGRGSAVRGSAVVLLGYPTGVDAILARTGASTLQTIAASSQGDSKQLMEALARRRLIHPVVTQGHIGDVLADKIVYDAQTTSGGSGGPLFNDRGEVIGINFATLRDFGGSNFAVPVRFGRNLLKP